MSASNDRNSLIGILQLAYSGELAAGYAYRGHWKSVSDEQEKNQIHKIEDDEWHHRKLVGEMLERLESRPDSIRETRAWLIGHALGVLCYITGWFAPMYGAGRLESRNIREYEAAARFARGCGWEEFIECLLTMAETEWEHEQYFRSRVLSHRWGQLLPLWPEPPPRETIRSAFFVESNPKGSFVPAPVGD